MAGLVAFVVVALARMIGAGPSVARAEVPGAPLQIADTEAATTQRAVWYGLQTLAPAATAGTMATAGILLCQGTTCGDWTLGIASTVFALGGGVVHLAHRNPRAAILGLVAKVALPAFGYAIGRAIDSCDPRKTYLCSDGESIPFATFTGVLFAVVAAGAIDVGLSTEPRATAEHAKVSAVEVLPTVMALSDRASIGLVGRF